MIECLVTVCLSLYMSYKAKEFLDMKMNEKSMIRKDKLDK